MTRHPARFLAAPFLLALGGCEAGGDTGDQRSDDMAEQELALLVTDKTDCAALEKAAHIWRLTNPDLNVRLAEMSLLNKLNAPKLAANRLTWESAGDLVFINLSELEPYGMDAAEVDRSLLIEQFTLSGDVVRALRQYGIPRSMRSYVDILCETLSQSANRSFEKTSVGFRQHLEEDRRISCLMAERFRKGISTYLATAEPEDQAAAWLVDHEFLPIADLELLFHSADDVTAVGVRCDADG